MRELDDWLRHRLRAVQLKQWRRGMKMFVSYANWVRAWTWLHALLATQDAGCATAHMGLNMRMAIAYFDRLGVPRFS